MSEDAARKQFEQAEAFIKSSPYEKLAEYKQPPTRLATLEQWTRLTSPSPEEFNRVVDANKLIGESKHLEHYMESELKGVQPLLRIAQLDILDMLERIRILRADAMDELEVGLISSSCAQPKATQEGLLSYSPCKEHDMNRSTRVLRFALEGEQEEQTIAMKGPLGEAMTKGLNIAYAKQDEVTGEAKVDGAALESEQQDVTIMNRLINAVNGSEDEDLENGVDIYAVAEQDVTPDTVVDVSNEMDDNEGGDDREFVVVADASAPSSTDGTGETEGDVIDLDAEEKVAEIELPAEGGEEAVALESEIKEGAFHKWLGKKKGEKITKKDISKGMKSDDAHVKKMAVFAKNMHKTELAKESLAEPKPVNKSALKSLRSIVLAKGGKFFGSLEEYVESLEVPVNPEIEDGAAILPETGAGDGQSENGGADGLNAGNIDHVTEQTQENGAAQPGVGATKD